MSISYDTFLPAVMPYVNDVPELIALQAIKDTCIEFCEKSLYWTYSAPDQDLVEDQSNYTISTPTGTVVTEVLDAWADGRTLRPKGEDDLKNMYPDNWHTQQGGPQYYTHVTYSTLTLVPYPNQTITGGLSMVIALKPSRASTTVDDTLFERWVEVISYGARSRLHMIPNQAFTDPASAAMYRSMFLAGINQARIERNKGLARTVTRVRPPRFV